MADARSDVAAWIAQGHLPAARVREALQLAQAMPTQASWLRFLDRLLFGAGAVALSAALGFFVAANWSALGRFGKLALVEVVVVTALALVAWPGIDSKWGRAFLVVAALAVGTLLALVGQTYQTGADPWELFAVWAVAVAPWVAIGRQPALWLLWLAVLALANVVVFQRGRLLEHGRVVRLELAPVDPRSLMQGDYMALEFAVAREATPQVRGSRSTSGALVLTLDERGVGRFVRRDDGSALAPAEARLRYRLRNDRVRLATDAWFFEEGQADAFAAARYGEFRVAPDGEALLARMLGEKLQPLGVTSKD